MMIDNNFFLETHNYLKKIATDIIIPNIGKLSENEVSTKEDNSKVTSYDVIIENELIEYFKNIGFSNIISEESNSELIKKNEYLTVDPIDGSNAWLHKTPTTHNDVNFIEAIIDTLSSEFNINNDRIYACGYSEGGIFSYELGCRLNNRIAAFASVSGSMLTESYRLTNGFGSCSPNHPTAVLLIPGTNDGILHSMYNGFQPYYLSVNEITTYWSTHNNTDPSQTVNMLHNLNTMDGSTVESRILENGNNCVSVKELKVINGDHDWPGSFGNMDINASQEIWKFVSKFDVNGLIDCGAVETSLLEFKPIRVYPNPTTSIINIENHTGEHQLIKIFNIHGAELHIEVLTDINNSISLKQYDQQILFIKMMNKVYRIILI